MSEEELLAQAEQRLADTVNEILVRLTADLLD